MQRREQLAHDPINAREFEIAVKSLANSVSYGMDDSIFLGAGVEYLQSRPYQHGDPVKLIDWRVTARTGKPYVKEYQAPKQMPVYMLVDTSASMCVSSLRMSKYAWAVQLATGLALAALERMSPVGVLGCGQRELHVKPSLSRSRIMQWGHQLRHYDFTETTRLGARVRSLAPTLRQRSVVLVLSDMHDPEAMPALKRLAQEHECVVLHLQDPAERDLRGAGIFRGQEAESGRAFVGHGRARWVDMSHVKGELVRSGVDYLFLPTDRPILAQLKQFLKLRCHLLGGAR